MVEANTKIANYHFRFGGQSEFQNVCPKQICAASAWILVESMRVAFQGEPDGQIQRFRR